MIAKSGMQWGTLGEWAAAAASVLVVLYALVTRISDRREAVRTFVREEAARVGVWHQGPGTPPENLGGWGMVVENRSSTPITDWTAALWWIRTGSPGSGPHWETHEMSSERLGPLPPGVRRPEQIGADWRNGQGEAVFPAHPANDFRVSMMWRDSADRWWLRYEGQLYGPGNDRYPLPWTTRPNHRAIDIDEVAQLATPKLRRRWWQVWRRLP